MHSRNILDESLHWKLGGLATDTYETTAGLGGSAPGFELSAAHPARPSVAARSNHVGFPEDSNVDQDKPQDDSRVLFVLPPQIPEGSQVAAERKHTLHNGRHVIREANDE